MRTYKQTNTHEHAHTQLLSRKGGAGRKRRRRKKVNSKEEVESERVSRDRRGKGGETEKKFGTRGSPAGALNVMNEALYQYVLAGALHVLNAKDRKIGPSAAGGDPRKGRECVRE